MSKQTAEIEHYIVPDGFRIEIRPDGAAEYIDVGVLAGGGTFTFEWDEVVLEAGNHKGLVFGGRRPVLKLSPSSILNFDIDVLDILFQNFTKKESDHYSGAGSIIRYTGGASFKMKGASIRLTHCEDDGVCDWQFDLYNAILDGGVQFIFKGQKEKDQGFNEIIISLTGRPDLLSTDALFSFFKKSHSEPVLIKPVLIGERGEYVLGDAYVLGAVHTEE